jgi:hypothetical protein
MWKIRLRQALLISILAFSLRSYLAYRGLIEYDEETYANAAIQYNRALRAGDWGAILNSTTNIEHPQLVKLVDALGLMVLKPVTELSGMPMGKPLDIVPYWPKLLWLRMISVICGTLVVFGLSLLSPAAGLFLALHTFAIKYTSVIYLEALPSFTSLAAVLCMLKAWKAYDAGKVTRTWLGWLVASGVALGAAAAGKYMYGIVGLAVVLAGAEKAWKRPRIMAGLAIWSLIALVAFFLLDPILWAAPFQRLGASIGFNVQYSQSDAVIASSAYPTWQPVYWLMLSIPQHSMRLLPFFVGPVDFFVLGDSVIFVLAAIGLPRCFSKNRTLFWWLVVGIFFLLLWRTKWPQYVVMVLPPLCYSAALGWEWLSSLFVKKTSNPVQSVTD